MKSICIFLYSYYGFYYYAFIGIIISCFFAALLKRTKQGRFYKSIVERASFAFLLIILNCLTTVWITHFSLFDNSSLSFGMTVLFRSIIMCACGLVIVFLCRGLFYFLHNLTHYISDTNKWGIATFCYLFIEFSVTIPRKIDGWVSQWYATDYSMGVGSRFFIGSLLHFFYSDYLDSKVVYIFCTFCTLVMIFFVSLMATKLFESSDNKYRLGLAYIWALFIVSPGSVVGFWQLWNFGRLELYCFLIGLMCICIYGKRGLSITTCAIITLLSCISMAIYQGNIFMYYSLVLMIFIWEIFSKKSLKSIIFAMINITFSCCAFLFFQFFSFTNFRSAQEMAAFLSKKTNLEITESAIDYELFQPISEAYKNINMGFLTGKGLPREHLIFTVLILTPIIVLFLGLYMKSYATVSKGIIYYPYLYFELLPLTILPQFILNVDWGRWLLSVNIVIFSGFLFLVWKKDSGAIRASIALSKWIYKHKILSGTVLIYIAGLGKFNGSTFISQVNAIIDWLTENNILNVL